jgi:cytosine permease
MSNLPDYIASAKPVPTANRAPWYKTIAPTYAGVMLWYVFWRALMQSGTPGSILSVGVGPALLGLLIAVLICHFLFYLVPGMLGMKTGLPLYVVGTSVYGTTGGLIMPGLLMGLLQFGWLAVNGWGVSEALCLCFQVSLKDATTVAVPSMWYGIIAATYIVFAAFVGLKGIQYVARFATWLPLIPLVVLGILLAKTAGGIGQFNPEPLIAAAKAADVKNPAVAFGALGVLAFVCTFVVGFFATAGAAGTDIASSARGKADVHWGGLIGIVLASLVAGGAAILIVAGAYGLSGPNMPNSLISTEHYGSFNPLVLLQDILGKKLGNIVLIALAISAFPSACFSSLIAANSFKTTMPKVNPSLSVGIGALIAVILAVTGVVSQIVSVFEVIGASFGPICGAMLADYLLSRGKWNGPRAGFNPAGWLSWFFGFLVGAFNLFAGTLSQKGFAWAQTIKDWNNVAPVAAFVVGFVLYLVFSMIGLKSKTIEMPKTNK